MDYVRAFIVGGLICVIGQILIDKTSLTPARILVSFVTAGVILTAVGVYEPIVKFGGAGATVPLPGFGYTLAKGAIKAVNEMEIWRVYWRCQGGSRRDHRSHSFRLPDSGFV